MPDLAFPPVGRLGSDGLPSQLPHLLRYYARLRLPLVLLDALCSRLVTDTLFVPFVRVPFPARYRSGTLALTPGLLGLSRYAFFPGSLQGNIWFSQVPRLPS